MSQQQPSDPRIALVEGLIREVPDFPKPGILFKDITPVLANPSLLAQTIDGMIEATGITQVDKVVGIDARGFIFGALIAERLGAGFIPANLHTRWLDGVILVERAA